MTLEGVQCQSKIVGDGRVSEPSLQCLAAARDRSIEKAECSLCFGERRMKDGDVGTEDQGSLDYLSAKAGIALLVAQDAKHVQRVGVSVIAVEDRLVQSSRSHKIARLVNTSRPCEIVARYCNHGNWASS